MEPPTKKRRTTFALDVTALRVETPPPCLFPELWGEVRLHLGTPLDSRDRVSLQRTCKGLYADDPGLLLAPLWQAAWNWAEEQTTSPFVWKEVQDRRPHENIIGTLKEIDGLGSWSLPLPTIIECQWDHRVEPVVYLKWSWGPRHYATLRMSRIGIWVYMLRILGNNILYPPQPFERLVRVLRSALVKKLA